MSWKFVVFDKVIQQIKDYLAMKNLDDNSSAKWR